MKRLKLSGVFIWCVCLLLSACGFGDEQRDNSSEIQEIVNDFYEASYEYDKVYSTQLAGITTKTVQKGKIIQPDYKEYIEIESPTISNVWTKAYYYGRGKVVNGEIFINGTWQSVKLPRNYPYGYGEKIHFSDPVKEDGISLYSAYYEVNMGRMTGEEKLIATVKQIYEVDEKNGELICIQTDLTDYNKISAVANDMRVNGHDLSEAQRAIANTDFTASEELRIRNYNGNIVIEEPSG